MFHQVAKFAETLTKLVVNGKMPKKRAASNPLKKRKLSRSGEYEATHETHTYDLRRKYTLHHLPDVALTRIFEYLTSNDLALNVRRVSTRFRLLAKSVINRRFYMMKVKLSEAIAKCSKALDSASTEKQMTKATRMLHCLKILLLNHSVIEACIWHYSHDKRANTSVCMYGTKVLDLFDEIVDNLGVSPEVMSRNYNLLGLVPKGLVKFCRLTKKFLLHFERTTEQDINKTSFAAGCKIIDILDCANFAERKILHQDLSDDAFTAKIRYRFSHSWFTCIKFNNDDPAEDWVEHMRLMFLRLRRIALAHTEVNLLEELYQCELAHDLTTRPPRPPNDFVYSGYGEINNHFFYYGSMNEGAYVNKNIQQSVSELMDNDEEPQLMEITVTVKCALQFAPLYIHRMGKENFDDQFSTRKRKPKGHFMLKLEINCPLSQKHRLPHVCTYYLTPKHSEIVYVE